MSALDSLKDPATGQIKKPVLISMIGAGGLLAYLVLSGKGGGSTAGSTSAGQSSLLTPDLSGLAEALKGFGNQGGGSSGSGSGSTGGTGTGTGTGAGIGTPIISSPNLAQPSSPVLPGSSGAAGGGGSGTGAVVHPIAKNPTVYGGLAAPVSASGSIAFGGHTPEPIPGKKVVATPSGSIAFGGHTPEPIPSKKVVATPSGSIAFGGHTPEPIPGKKVIAPPAKVVATPAKSNTTRTAL